MRDAKRRARAGRITVGAIVPSRMLQSVIDEEAGGIVLFLGTVRNNSEAGRVEGLAYEAYTEMAEKKLREIEEDVTRRWPVRRVKIVHRVGKLRLGEVSVAVAVSAAHRAEAFDACRHAIERIKGEVPIWKKEKLEGGRNVWVAGKIMGG